MSFINNSYFWVGLGGALGAMGRVGISAFFPSFIFNIPLKILCVNIIGCFIAGIVVEFMAFYSNLPTNARAFLIQGLLGGFTTFSAFAIEFGLLYEKESYFLAILYAILSVVLSIIFFFCGLRLTRILF